MLSELDSVPVPNDSGKKKGKTAKASDDAPQEVPVQEMTSIDDVQAAMDAPGVSKTRKQKLKQRLKQLQVFHKLLTISLHESSWLSFSSVSAEVRVEGFLMCT